MKQIITSVNTPLSTTVDWNKKSTLKILAVDDDAMNQQLFPALLSKIGYTCTVVKNGQEAIDLVLKEPFDIIFMDMHMPIIDGLEATRQIRSALQTPETPIIIALTANNFADEKERCLAAGMNDFMIKPYRIANMQQVLDKWTEGIKVK